MTTPAWQPGAFYNPGALVRPRSTPPVDVGQPDNPGFETGTTADWTATPFGGVGTFQATTAQAFKGTHAGQWIGGSGSGSEGGIEAAIVSDERAVVRPAQRIVGKCYIKYNTAGAQPASQGQARIYWYDSGGTFISFSRGTLILGRGNNNRWVVSTVTGIAPLNAAFASMAAWLTCKNGNIFVDEFSWDYAYKGIPDGLVFRAVQANAGFSASTEPVWPTVLGNTVVDNEVTWEAVAASRVTWEAEPILKSGATEPVWSTLPGGGVVDNGKIVWEAISRRIEDENCPHTKVVMIGASKIFAGDDDIIRFSATVNPLDWTTVDDAGYLPFGLQTYGANPVAVLGLYRSNLVAMNSQGFQMWQIDPDPANMAFLDAVPVGSTYVHTWIPIANDLVGLTQVGVRNLSIAGASTNLQADGVGEPIDALVRPAVKLLDRDDDVLALFWPAMGQHWTIFGDTAYVLTINAAKKKSWSRYVFPEEIVNATLAGNTLVLRTATGKVWDLSDDALLDDMHGDADLNLRILEDGANFRLLEDGGFRLLED